MAKKTLPHGDLKNIMPNAAIRMGDGHVVHSCGVCEVDVPMALGGLPSGSMSWVPKPFASF